jgi:hypothetical protein
MWTSLSVGRANNIEPDVNVPAIYAAACLLVQPDNAAMAIYSASEGLP